MPAYERARAEFSWAAARAALAELPGGGLDIAHEAADRHANGPLAETAAPPLPQQAAGPVEYTYAP
jgi:acetyl-CoA synthetase